MYSDGLGMICIYTTANYSITFIILDHVKECVASNSVTDNPYRKYKDYVYRKMLVQEYLKK